MIEASLSVNEEATDSCPEQANFFLRDRSLFMWGRGWGGGKSWIGPGLFFSEKRGGPKENFTMVGSGSLCVL